MNDRELLGDIHGAFPQTTNILTLVQACAQAKGDAEALRSASSRMSYAQMMSAARANAARMYKLGIRPGDFVLCAIRSGVRLPLAWISAMLAGAVIVPVDVGWPASRRLHVQRATGAALVLVSDGKSGSVFDNLFAFEVTVQPAPDCEIDNRHINQAPLLYGFFTSGSTGTPKCALNHHAGVVNRFRYMTKRFGSGHVVYQNSSPLFDSSIWQMIWPLVSGGIAVLPEHRGVWDLEQVVSDISAHKVTMTDFVPTLFAELVKAMKVGRVDVRSLETLQHVLIGGEQIDARAVHEFRKMLPGCEVVNTYGHTEASIGMVFHSVCDADGLDIPIGAPIDNTFVKITDANLACVTNGEVGEIVIGGICVGGGYLGRPDLNSQVFLPNPFPDIPGDRVYRSGDFGRWRADGLLEYHGRADDQIKLNGVRIELSEVEAAVKAVFANITDARAFVVEIPEQGRLLALAYSAAEPVEQRAMRSALVTQLPASLVPRLYLHKLMLPTTENGKTDRQALLAEVREKALVVNSRLVSDVRTSILQMFRTACCNEALEEDDDFFEAGGDSLAAVELATRLEALLGYPVLSGDIYRNSSAAAFAALCANDNGQESGRGSLPIPPAKGLFSKPVTPVKSVLLTGATGFVGLHVLAALLARKDLKLHLIVRASDAVRARARVKHAYKEAFGKPPEESDLHFLCGDLSRPQFGLNNQTWADLATRVDEVIHCGAEVNFMAPASQLYATNVLGTAEAVHLCGTGRPKHLHFVSSLAARDILGEEHASISQQRQGYAVTKWLAEQIVVRASTHGLYATTYRVDDVLPSATTGFGNVHSLAHLLLQRCVSLGLAPQGAGMLGLLTADGFGTWLASLVGRQIDAPYSMYQVTGSGYVDFHDLVTLCAVRSGRPVKSVTMSEVVQALTRTSEAPDLLLAHLLRDRGSDVLFTPPGYLISTEQLPFQGLLHADAGALWKFLERGFACSVSR